MTQTYQINNNLFLTQCIVNKKTVEPSEVPVNNILCLDVSGSMYNDLPKIRQQLKLKLPTLLSENDTISIIWFSGKDEFGTLIEAEKVNNLTDLSAINKLIDRWLTPNGLTGFKQPLEEVNELIKRIKNDNVFSLFFMSDGCDNQWQQSQIIETVEKLSDKLASATIVEYGFYADRNLLLTMAEKIGGNLIFSENFDKYQPAFENVLQKKISGKPRIKVQIDNALHDVVYMIDDKDLIIYKVQDGCVSVPEDANNLWYLTETAKDFLEIDIEEGMVEDNKQVVDSLYAALAVFSMKMKSDVVYSILKLLGDVTFIKQFSGCFGKQKYSDFIESCKQAMVGERFKEGRDVNAIPDDDAFTVIELLNVLNEDENNKILVDHKLFKYNRIGQATVDANTVLLSEEKKKINDLTNEMSETKDIMKIKEIMDQINSVLVNKKKPVTFEINSEEKKNGYSISTLNFSSVRPNVSIMLHKTGTVDISHRVPEKYAETLPKKVKSSIFRNYAIISDGIVNVDVLPARLSEETLKRIPSGVATYHITQDETEENFYTLDLKKLPVINRKMVKDVSVEVLCKKEYELIELQAKQKVYNTYKKDIAPKKSVGFSEIYGSDVAEWLKEELGITDYNGFSPKVASVESGDYYLGKELLVKIKGLSTLPSVKDVKEKMLKNKLTPSASLMVDVIKEVEKNLSDDDLKQGFEKWIDDKLEEVRKQIKKLLYEISQIKFAVIVGQVWFKEFDSLEENVWTLENKVQCTIELKEVEVKI